MWILGTLSPLPKNMHWQPKEVEAAIASAQAVLDPPRVNVNANLGFFGKLTLLPSLVGVRDNPDHKTLQQVVPPDLYARWIALKTKYFGAGRGRNIESWRPLFIDYLFLSFNTSTAFSPTDAPILSRWAKMLTMTESILSLTTLLVLIARAINTL